MFKYILVGVWVCGITLGSSYAAMIWSSGKKVEAEETEFFGGLDYVKTPGISVPIISDNKVKGYVLTELVFTIDGKKHKEMTVPVDAYLVHEAIKAIYSADHISFDDLQQNDIAAIAASVRNSVNTRFDSELIADVLLQDIKFLPADQIRTK